MCRSKAERLAEQAAAMRERYLHEGSGCAMRRLSKRERTVRARNAAKARYQSKHEVNAWLTKFCFDT